MKHRGAGATLIVAALCAAPSAAQAVSWVISPTLSVQAGGSDNVRLREEDTETTTEGSVTAGAIVERITETFQLRATGTTGYTGYTGGADAPDDGDFQTLQGEVGYWTELGVWRLNGAFFRDLGLVDVAIPDNRIDPGADIDAGTVEESVRRYRATIEPSFTRQITERVSAGAGYTGTYLDYKDEALAEQASIYHEFEVRSDWEYSERARLGLALSSGFFRPGEDERAFDTYALVADSEYRLSERTSLEASAGVRLSDPAASGDDGDSETGFVGRFGGVTRGESWQAAASIERQLRPSGRGELKETDQFLLSASRDVSQRLAVELAGRAFVSRAVGNGGDDDSEKYASVSPSITYRLTPEWSLSGEYLFQVIRRSDTDERADSNTVLLRLEYEPLREAPGF